MANSRIGNLIRMRRKELGLTQSQVAEFCGVNKSSVSLWENGLISNMKRDKIAKLAKILQMSPAELIDIESDKFEFHLTAEQSMLIYAYNAASEEMKDGIFRLLGLTRPASAKKENNE